MAKNDKVSWWRQHKSAALIFSLFVVGLGLVIAGIFVEAQPSDYEKFLGKLMIELSIACIVGCIATIFLSLREVRSQLSSVLGTLFSEGEVVGLLTIAARQLLNKKLLTYRLGSEVAKIDEELFERLSDLTEECLRSLHLEDYTVVTTIGPHPTNEAFFYEQNVINFRINIAHIVGETPRRVQFPFEIGYEIDLPPGTNMTDEEFLLEFRLRVGDAEFTEAPIKHKEDGDIRSMHLEFNREFELVSATTAVQIRYEVARLRSDNISIWRARYPTRGFQMTIYYARGFDYNCKWFASINPKKADGTFALLDNAIIATRDDWCLPREGIAIYWTPKEQSAAPEIGK